MNRRQVLAAVAAGCTGTVAGCSTSTTEPPSGPPADGSGTGTGDDSGTGPGDGSGDGTADDGGASDGGGDTQGSGGDSTGQSTGPLDVVSRVGVLGDAGERVSTARVGVELSADADPIDLREVTITFVSGSAFADLVHETSGGADGTFRTTAIGAADPDDAVVSEPGDRYEIELDLENEASLTALDPGEECFLTITVPDGTRLSVTLRAPDSLAEHGGGNSVDL